MLKQTYEKKWGHSKYHMCTHPARTNRRQGAQDRQLKLNTLSPEVKEMVMAENKRNYNQFVCPPSFWEALERLSK
jgi:hypothetical protein